MFEAKSSATRSSKSDSLRRRSAGRVPRESCPKLQIGSPGLIAGSVVIPTITPLNGARKELRSLPSSVVLVASG